jgi:hypothetical protein
MSKDRRRSNYGPFLTYYCGINLKAEEKPWTKNANSWNPDCDLNYIFPEDELHTLAIAFETDICNKHKW